MIAHSITGINIHYEISGSGPVVVFAHSLGSGNDARVQINFGSAGMKYPQHTALFCVMPCPAIPEYHDCRS